jgi:hypothetical protein
MHFRKADIVQIDRCEGAFRPEVFREVCRLLYFDWLSDDLLPCLLWSSIWFVSKGRRELKIDLLFFCLEFVFCLTINTNHTFLLIVL